MRALDPVMNPAIRVYESIQFIYVMQGNPLVASAEFTNGPIICVLEAAPTLTRLYQFTAMAQIMTS